MSARAALRVAGAERNSGVGSPNVNVPPLTSPPVLRTADDSLLLRKYQQLTRKHLNSFFDRLLVEYTGLNFRIIWATTSSREWDVGKLPTETSLCCRRAKTEFGTGAKCERCGPKHLSRAMASATDGLYFECGLGVLNYWRPIRVRDLIVGIAYLQAVDGAKSRLRAHRATRSATGVLSRAEFRRARGLLQLIVDYLQTLDVADLRKTELTKAGQAVLALEREQARLHEAVERHLPGPALVARRAGSTTHSEEAVHQILECVSQEFSKPITLRSYASKLGLNPAYVSALFSRAVGVSFKTYLTRIRMLKARALLGDLNRTVSEVSYAVGYSNENRFRKMFKKATGLAPKVWRATLRAHGLVSAGWLLDRVGFLTSLELPFVT